MSVLVTGGAGYIGSHTCIQLLEAGQDVVIVDNLSNSSQEAVHRIEALSGKGVTFYDVDICDRDSLDNVFSRHDLDSVIHFAGLKAVGESVAQPLKYYENNVVGSTVLFELMAKHNVKKLVFSSSATVYGDPHAVPIIENFPLQVTNPYGRTKLFVEDICRDIFKSDDSWQIILLRYFNPVGAHASGDIGEDPNDIPNNLMPYISQVAVGKREKLSVFGSDYETADGTGVRDYIHVEDLANGHLKAIDKLRTLDQGCCKAINLGTGVGYSVLDMVKHFEAASGCSVSYDLVDRRPGDVAVCYADPALAFEELGWKAEKGVESMCEDTWRWQSKNPNGYKAS